jgi:hypothetical protein
VHTSTVATQIVLPGAARHDGGQSQAGDQHQRERGRYGNMKRQAVPPRQRSLLLCVSASSRPGGTTSSARMASVPATILGCEHQRARNDRHARGRHEQMTRIEATQKAI